MLSNVHHSHHYGREEEEQPREPHPSQLPRQEEDEQPLQHSAPLLLSGRAAGSGRAIVEEELSAVTAAHLLPVQAGSAQEGVQWVQEFAQDTQREASTDSTRDALWNPAGVLKAKRNPGLLAKTVKISVPYSPAGGGWVPAVVARSVHCGTWKYTMAGSQKGCNSGTAI